MTIENRTLASTLCAVAGLVAGLFVLESPPIAVAGLVVPFYVEWVSRPTVDVFRIRRVMTVLGVVLLLSYGLLASGTLGALLLVVALFAVEQMTPPSRFPAPVDDFQ